VLPSASSAVTVKVWLTPATVEVGKPDTAKDVADPATTLNESALLGADADGLVELDAVSV